MTELTSGYERLSLALLEPKKITLAPMALPENNPSIDGEVHGMPLLLLINQITQTGLCKQHARLSS